ncbi:MAG: hypothetical protein ACREIF_13720 [Chthoniobacterales bacterium]
MMGARFGFQMKKEPPRKSRKPGDLLARHGLRRLRDGTLDFTRSVGQRLAEAPGFHAVYREACLRYLNILDDAFCRAMRVSEFELINLLIRVRGCGSDDWDPWTSTKQNVKAVRSAIRASEGDYLTERTLQLWLWGHIVEASEPYEIYINLARIISGQRYNFLCFPPVGKSRRLPTPGEKIAAIKRSAAACGEEKLAMPLHEIWDRAFRNAIFHSEYSLHESDIRIRRPVRVVSHEEFMILLNRALASHDALCVIESLYRGNFDKPRKIDVHREFAKWPGEKAWVMVREDYGVIGLCDALADGEISEEEGKIRWMVGKFYPEENSATIGGQRQLYFPARPA